MLTQHTASNAFVPVSRSLELSLCVERALRSGLSVPRASCCASSLVASALSPEVEDAVRLRMLRTATRVLDRERCVLHNWDALLEEAWERFVGSGAAGDSSLDISYPHFAALAWLACLCGRGTGMKRGGQRKKESQKKRSRE